VAFYRDLQLSRWNWALKEEKYSDSKKAPVPTNSESRQNETLFDFSREMNARCGGANAGAPVL